MEAGRVRYNITMKFHYMAHLPELAATINPIRVTTYLEESHLGHGSKIYNHAAYKKNAQRAVLEKWLIAMQLRIVDSS